MSFTFQINDGIVWNRNEELLKKAEVNKPVLHRTKITPTALVDIIEDKDMINGYAAVESERDIQNLSDYVVGRDESLIIDLGNHYVGSLSVNIDSVGCPMDAPLYLRLKFAEIPAEIPSKPEDYDGWLSKSWIQEEYVHIDVLPAKLELPRRYACRYIELKVIDTSPKWKASFSQLEFTAESSVLIEQAKPFETNDFKLKAIYDVSVKTLVDCMQSVFEDGPKRDRRLWIGDLRLQALANYYTFNDLSLVKRGLYLFGGMTTEEGKIPANVFTSPKLIPDDTFLFDYSVFFASILHDYFDYTKDEEVLQDLYPMAKKMIDFALELVDNEGRLTLREDYPVFIDWSNEFEKNSCGQAILIYSLKHFLKLSNWMSIENVESYETILGKMEKFAKEKLYDANKKQFILEENDEINIITQVWMVLAQVMDDETNKEIMLETIKNQFPVTGIATPYTYHHLVEAMFVSGLKEEAIDFMKGYWGKMIDMGADTFWEAFKPEAPDFSPYGSPIVNSYCHAWSCTPAYLIKKYL